MTISGFPSRTPIAACALIAMVLLMQPSVQALDVVLDITSGEAKPIDIALPFFTCAQPGNESIIEEIHRIFVQDLEYSNRFTVVDISRFFPTGTTEMTNPNFKEWYLAGIAALITGHINMGGDEIEVNMRLFDVPMGNQIIGVRYKTPYAKLRTVIHKFADEVQFRLTGERGISFSQISFVSNKSGHQEIYVVDPDGGLLQEITANGTTNLSPAWAPGGGKIYYTSYAGGRPDLYVYDLESSKSSPLVKGGMNITPAISADGQFLTWSMSFDGDPEIVVAPVSGKSPKRLTSTPGVDCNPSFSPGGNELVFTSDRSGDPQLYIMDIEGGNLRRLTVTGDYNTAADWSPRGDWIVYHSRREGVFNLWLVHPDGSDDHQVTADAGHNEDPCFARDGRHFTFISSRNGGKGLYISDLSGQKVRPVLIMHGICANPSWSR